MIFIFAFLVSSQTKFIERGTECRACTYNEFRNYSNCHSTGFILTHAKKDAIQACTPKLAKTYFNGFKIVLILLFVTINFIIVSRLRKNCLLQNSYIE